MSEINRREFFNLAALSASGFLVACTTAPKATREKNLREPSGRAGYVAMSAWLYISPSNDILFLLDKGEMGQGVITSLAAIVAEELNTDPKLLRVEYAPIEEKYDNPAFEVYATGGSSSIAMSWNVLRETAALAKQRLIKAGAEKLGVSADKCEMRDRKIFVRSNPNKQVSFGEVALAAGRIGASAEDARSRVGLKPVEQFEWIGKKLEKRDAYEKITGLCNYSIDIDVADMLYAKVVRAPRLGAKLINFDRSSLPSGVEAVAISTGVAVVAKSFWTAERAAEKVLINWDFSASPIFSDATIQGSFDLAEKKSGVPVVLQSPLRGGGENSPSNVLEAKYQVPYMPHLTMEPPTCVAYVRNGLCEVWTGTQVPGGTRAMAAQAAGVSQDRVMVHQLPMGGSFGRRIAQDFVCETVEISRQVQRPVKLIWTRTDDIRHDFFRPASRHVLRASTGSKGPLSFWEHKIIAPSIFKDAAKEFTGGFLPKVIFNSVLKYYQEKFNKLFSGPLSAIDPTTAEGAAHFPYKVSRLKVNLVNERSRVPVGFWRSVGYSANVYVMEGFIDELAYHSKQDPFEFRRLLLQEAVKNPNPTRLVDQITRRIYYKPFQSPIFDLPDPKRALNCLEMVAKMSKWGRPEAGVFQGIAQSICFGSYCAQVVEIRKDNGVWRLHKVYAAVDAGFIVNPDGAREQIEGGIIFGLSAALKHRILIKDGAVVQSNFHDLDLLRMHEIPKFEIEFVASKAEPTGIGELGVPSAAPALANAFFRATGVRHRGYLVPDSETARQSSSKF